MASELKVDKFTGVSTAGSILVTGEGNSTTTNLQQGLAKSFLAYKGTSTNVIYDSIILKFYRCCYRKMKLQILLIILIVPIIMLLQDLVKKIQVVVEELFVE